MNGRVEFKIVENPIFDPSIGTVTRAVARCPVCGSTINDKHVKRLFKEGEAGQKIVAVVLRRPGQPGKFYRIGTGKDWKVYKEAEKFLEDKRQMLREKWGLDPVPDEEIPSTMPGGIHTPTYGMTRWGDNYFDAVHTDPPYYYNVTYADLSDFFYVWLKRTISGTVCHSTGAKVERDYRGVFLGSCTVQTQGQILV